MKVLEPLTERERIFRAAVVVWAVVLGAFKLLMLVALLRFTDSGREIRSVYENLPAAAKDLPPLAVEVVEKVVTPSFRSYWAGRLCILKIHDRKDGKIGMGNTSWQLRNALTGVSIPATLTPREQIAIAWQAAYFRPGFGLKAGAKKFYAREPQDLTADELIWLWAYSESPQRSAERHDARAKILQAVYHQPAAP